MPTPPHLVLLALPKGTPDRYTALADLRAAWCLHDGVDIDDIDPATGYDLSLRSYLSARDSWRSHFLYHPPTEWTVAGCARARALWARKRPEYVAAHPWVDLDALTKEMHDA